MIIPSFFLFAAGPSQVVLVLWIPLPLDLSFFFESLCIPLLRCMYTSGRATPPRRLPHDEKKAR